MDMKMIEFVYDALQGDVTDTMPPNIENAFAEGAECLRLYQQVYEAERRLEARLGVGVHDKDVECIICAMRDITQYLCFKMYAYGAQFGYDRRKLYEVIGSGSE